jgi:hypothetical protein
MNPKHKYGFGLVTGAWLDGGSFSMIVGFCLIDEFTAFVFNASTAVVARCSIISTELPRETGLLES